MRFNLRHYIGYGLALAIVSLLAVLVASCSATPSAVTSAPVSTTATVPAASNTPSADSPAPSSPAVFQRRGTSGTISTISGNTLTVSSPQGNQVTVDVGSSTAIEKTVAGSLSDLQPGLFLTVVGTPDADGVISATSIMIRSQGFPTPPPGATFTPRAGTYPQGNGSGSGFPGNFAGRGTFGTLKSLNGDTLTLTTVQGNDVTVNINDATAIQKTVSGTLSDLQPGQFVNVTGPQGADGNIAAGMISIQPARQSSPAPSPSA